MLLLAINRKPYLDSLMTPSLLTLGDLERSKSRSLRFQSLISRKAAELGLVLLLAINRKPYMATPMTPSVLTLSDLERSKSKVTQILKLISHKGTQIRPYVTNIHQLDTIYGESNDITYWPWVKVTRILSLISRKWVELGSMLLLTINMASPMTSSLMTLSDLERSKARSLGFQRLNYI